ncbi:MAG: hypothetical protein CMLOHMNK_03322 [Steroidobacteraceae bacterium]|nr:hypothetical protein [Steroidobacteraceae bacterium]
MGLSETIIAAIIGASATVSAAGFQLMRTRSQPSVRPRRSTLRAMLTLVALVIASAAGGYAYSELRADGARQEMARLRGEINDQLQALAVANARRAEVMPALPPVASSEALVQLAACVRSGADSDGPAPICEAQSVAPTVLCTQIPSTAERLGIDRYSRPLGADGDWQVHAAEAGAVTHDVSFVDAAPGYVATADSVPVCVNVWNEDPSRAQVARIVVRYQPRQAAPPPVAAR